MLCPHRWHRSDIQARGGGHTVCCQTNRGIGSERYLLINVRFPNVVYAMALGYRPPRISINRLHPFGTPVLQKPLPRHLPRLHASTTISTDVVIIGSGIVGLSIASAMLRADDKVGVVLVDRAGLCAGATGAGQGYLWLAHRDPAANIAAWELASRSVKLWQELMGSAPRVREQTEYRVLGSMLIATCAEDADALKCHAGKLRDAGIADVTYYTASMAQDVEPMLTLPSDGAAIVVPTDAQIDGRATTSMFLELISAQFNKVSNRFEAIYHDECRSLVADPSTGRISGVETGSGTRIMATHGVIVAAGAWSGDFLSRELENAKWKDVLRARKGHLVEIPGSEIPRPKGYDASNRPLLRHGLMEFGYSNHYRSHPVENSNSEGVDVTFTATTSASGSLLLGSSRQFVQQFPACHTDAFTSDADVVTAIIEEARQFIPSLTPPLHECLKVANVRVGPRPYSSTGMPLIGPVPDTPGLFLAAGHEGSGLTLCLATAEIIVDYVLGDQTQGTNDNKRNFIDVLRPRTL